MDWPTIAQVGTAAGTLVLAIATYASVRESRRSSRIAEETLALNLRPVLVTSRVDDPPLEVMFGDGRYLKVQGTTAAVEVELGNVWLGIALRNAGAGLAVINGWRITHREQRVSASRDEMQQPSLDQFRPHTRDLYVPAGDIGFWQGAIREPYDGDREETIAVIEEGEDVLIVDLLYGDHRGGQQAISRFSLRPQEDGRWLSQVVRHWEVDATELK